MKNKLKCYISAPAGFDLTKIEIILDKLKIEYHNFYDFSAGTTFSELIYGKIKESNFVISILTADNANVLFELGVADGMRKPLFILIDKDFKVPFFLEKKNYFLTNFSETKLVELALSNFIDITASLKKIKKQSFIKLEEQNLKRKKLEQSKTEPKKAQKELDERKDEQKISLARLTELQIKSFYLKNPNFARRKKTKHNLSQNEITNLIHQVSVLRLNQDESKILILIKDILTKLFIYNTSISEIPIDKGVDLIIRSNELTPYFGNPIFIEIKLGKLNIVRLNEAHEQLHDYISRTDAKGGIILYLDRDNKRYSCPLKYPFILCFDLEDFILGIASEGIEEFLINKRNLIAHGTWK